MKRKSGSASPSFCTNVRTPWGVGLMAAVMLNELLVTTDGDGVEYQAARSDGRTRYIG